MDINRPCLRLFLSVDLVGSTALKDRYSYLSLLKKYEERKASLLNLIKHSENTGISSKNPHDPLPKEAIEYLFPDVAGADCDWSEIIRQHFEDFHASFSSRFAERQKKSAVEPENLTIWKCMGDEIIYCIKINEPHEIHNITLDFLMTMRSYDEKACTKGDGPQKLLRLKGTGWTAGFPIRNKEVVVGGSKADYLGPDMDIGFRLTQHTYPGFMCISMDLAYLLGKQDNSLSQLVATIVGWSTLKGVWNNKPYPIIWIAPPRYCKKNSGYQDMRPWAPYESQYAKVWNLQFENNNPFPESIELLKTIEETRSFASDDLGLIPPYIASSAEEPDVPALHKQIYELLSLMSKGPAGSQGEDDTPQSGDAAATQEIEKMIEDINSIHIESKHEPL